ncbi:MAG: hypothetical protein DRN99_04405 [Thermoproteota archaeon]|nr:MAG: hypothetical protein DRN99_04405 [Candidatus Korarchaeota archaeon]
MSVEAVIETLLSTPEYLKKLAKALAPEVTLEIATSPELREAVVKRIAENAATKKDIEELRKEIREAEERTRRELKTYIDLRVKHLEERINAVEKRIDDLYGMLKATLIAIVLTLLSTILAPLLLKAIAP